MPIVHGEAARQAQVASGPGCPRTRKAPELLNAAAMLHCGLRTLWCILNSFRRLTNASARRGDSRGLHPTLWYVLRRFRLLDPSRRGILALERQVLTGHCPGEALLRGIRPSANPSRRGILALERQILTPSYCPGEALLRWMTSLLALLIARTRGRMAARAATRTPGAPRGCQPH